MASSVCDTDSMQLSVKGIVELESVSNLVSQPDKFLTESSFPTK